MSRHDDAMRIRRNIPLNHPAYKAYETKVLDRAEEDLRRTPAPPNREPDLVDAVLVVFLAVAALFLTGFLLFLAVAAGQALWGLLT